MVFIGRAQDGLGSTNAASPFFRVKVEIPR